jgi:hypothetical protein
MTPEVLLSKDYNRPSVLALKNGNSNIYVYSCEAPQF